MPDFWVFIWLPVLWLLVGPILGLVLAARANRRSGELIGRIDALEARLAVALVQPDDATAAAIALKAAGLETRKRLANEEALATEMDLPPVSTPSSWEPADIAAPAEPTAEPSPEPLASPERPRESLESRIGARWSVLVGGLALVMGAVFLVRFSIEQGLLGPGMRIALGFLLSAALFAGGEALRRRDRALALPVFARADIPAILTGAGGLAAFATIYAAYALYGFIGDAAAFILLTLAGLATLLLSVIHGPWLAALGALGSYAAPLFVGSAEPKPMPVVLHTLAVTAAVMGMARIRGWRRLAVSGIVASLAWGVLTGLIGNVETAAAELILLAGLTSVFVAALIVGTPATLRDRDPDRLAVGALAGIAALSVFYALVDSSYPPLAAGIVLTGAFGAAASRWTSVAGAMIVAGLLAVVSVMLIRVAASPDLATLEIGTLAWTALGEAGLARFALKAGAIALVIGVGAFLTADRAAATAPRSAGIIAVAGAGAPLIILAVVYLRHVPFQTRPGIGITALALAAAFAALAERLIGRRPGDFAAPAPAFYAAGAVLALAFAASVGLETRFIPLALALGTAGIVWVWCYRPVAALPWLAVVCAALACAALIAGPPMTAEAIGATRILNGLVLRLGLPAASILIGAELLRRREDGAPAGILQAIGMALGAFFVAAEIRHTFDPGFTTAAMPGLAEQGAYTLATLAFSLGLQKIAARTQNAVYRIASLIAGILGAAAIAVTHFVVANPYFSGESVGAAGFFNTLLPGYLMPALLAAWVAAAARNVRPRWYVLAMAVLALGLGFAWLTFSVRHGFHGTVLSTGETSDAENWSYSAIWLGYGIALLAAGIWLRSAAIRAASGLIVAIVVCKVFLFDMAALTGALRAVSFLGLGGVLIVIGRLYQRLLPRAAVEPQTTPGDAPAR